MEPARYPIEAVHATVHYVQSGEVRTNLVIVKSPKTKAMRGRFYNSTTRLADSENIPFLYSKTNVKQVMKHETDDLLNQDKGRVCITLTSFKLLLTMEQLVTIQKQWWAVEDQIESFKQKIEARIVGDEFQEYLAMIMCAGSYLHGDIVEAMSKFLKET